MMHELNTKRGLFYLIIGLLLSSFLLLGFASSEGDLPPRPTPITKTVISPSSSKGGFIELNLGAAGAGRDTIVQWQNAQGEWFDVETWFGQTEPDGSKMWWVAPEDFDTGPFRWVLLNDEGEAVSSSEPFEMPTRNGQSVVSTIELE
ncbi:MAG: hypothetical protein QNJ45_15235 [Ardenticatenaceae bacterium]|nr:hypothetical protein [Ardenticatenaceae bacterium]